MEQRDGRGKRGGIEVAKARGGRGRVGGRCNTHYTNYMAPVNDQLPTVIQCTSPSFPSHTY